MSSSASRRLGDLAAGKLRRISLRLGALAVTLVLGVPMTDEK
jgi:hypothetical protein